MGLKKVTKFVHACAESNYTSMQQIQNATADQHFRWHLAE